MSYSLVLAKDKVTQRVFSSIYRLDVNEKKIWNKEY